MSTFLERMTYGEYRYWEVAFLTPIILGSCAVFFIGTIVWLLYRTARFPIDLIKTWKIPQDEPF